MCCAFGRCEVCHQLRNSMRASPSKEAISSKKLAISLTPLPGWRMSSKTLMLALLARSTCLVLMLFCQICLSTSSSGTVRVNVPCCLPLPSIGPEEQEQASSILAWCPWKKSATAFSVSSTISETSSQSWGSNVRNSLHLPLPLQRTTKSKKTSFRNHSGIETQACATTAILAVNVYPHISCKCKHSKFWISWVYATANCFADNSSKFLLPLYVIAKQYGNMIGLFENWLADFLFKRLPAGEGSLASHFGLGNCSARLWREQSQRSESFKTIER